MTLIRGCTGVESVDAVDVERAGASTLAVTYDGDEWAVAEIVNTLAKAQIAVSAVEPERTDLERIFMDVTTQAAREKAHAPSGSAQPQRGVR